MLNKHCFLLSPSLLLICHLLRFGVEEGGMFEVIFAFRFFWLNMCLSLISYLSLLPQVSNTEGVAMATTTL